MSEEFNPPNTGNSSNPSWLYVTLSQAIYFRDSNDAKLTQTRDKLLTVLLEAISSNWGRKENLSLERDIVEIRQAPIELFRPQVWKIDLRKVDARTTRGQYKFERLVPDLQCHEFEIIIE